MSYVRWGSDGSDVYVYLDASGGWTCACGIVGMNLITRSLMINHLRDHVKQGDKVPLRVFKAFLLELRRFGETEERRGWE